MTAAVADERGVITECPSCHQKNRLTYSRLQETTRCGRCKTELPRVNNPVEVTTAAEFDSLISSASLPVVVDFWAPWCGPCRMVAPEIEKVASRRAGQWLVVKVNTDEVAGVGDRLGIRSIPTMAVFKDGREVTRTAGARPASDIDAFVSNALR
ncbi:MAG TPA: thioredoxin TrxC [Vicinamibacterales bacterium]|nr:thioredoxin TrxC [Vicinamibacterales bacterium]